MIELIFYKGTEITLIRITGKHITFSASGFGRMATDISGLKLDYAGCCREHPDLELRKDWKEESIKRFKEKINKMNTENEIANYIIEDLKKLIDSPLSFRFQYAKEESQDSKVLTEILDVWLKYFREILLSFSKQRSGRYSLLKIKKIINLIQDIKFLLSKTEINPKSALEMILLEL